MSLTDHPDGEPPTSDENPPVETRKPYMSWRNFAHHLAVWPANDARKIALVQIVDMTDGQAGQDVDADELAGRLERSKATAEQALRKLAPFGWIELASGVTDDERRRPRRRFTTTRWIHG